MDIFGKKAEKKIAELESKLEQSMRAIKEEYEEKGYFSSNEQNEYFKQISTLAVQGLKLLEFDTVNREQLAKMYWTNAQVRGIVNLIASAVSELADYAELVDKEDKVQNKHHSIDLLEQPNDRENKRRFIKTWAINRLLTGDAFVYFDGAVGTKFGQYNSMYVMPSQEVDIIKGGLTKPIAGYKLKTEPSLSPKLDEKNVMMSYEPNPKPNNYYGLSPLESAANYIQLLEAGLKRNNSSIVNGGAANIITPKPDNMGSVTPTMADNAEEALNGKTNFNKNKFLKVPLEVHSLGDKPTDLGILDTSKDAITALCFVYNIPIDMYFGQAKYDNTKEAKKSVYEQAAIPLFNEFLQDYSKFLKLEKEGLKWKLNTDKIEVLRENINDTLDAYTKMNASLNEKRELMGFPEIEEEYANKPMIPLGISFGEATFTDINEME